MEEWFCVCDFLCSDFIILARLHCFWWIGVVDEPVLTALTTHYLCWTSLTTPDSRSFRPAGGPRGIHFLNWWIVLRKVTNGWGHSQNYWPKNILVLRSIIPRYGFSIMVNRGYAFQIQYEVSWWAFGHLLHWKGLVGKGLFYQSNLTNPLVSFGSFQNTSHKFTLRPIPRKSQGKMYKKPGNNIVFPNVGHYCTWTHCKQSPWENVQKNQVEKSTKVNNILEAHAISSYL
jgi:hypothetical protein